MDGALIHDLHRVDQLRQAAAAAAPAIERLVAAGAANGISEREVHLTLGSNTTVARWCHQQLRTLEQGDADQQALAAAMVGEGVKV
jgi:hypothetical protein